MWNCIGVFAAEGPGLIRGCWYIKLQRPFVAGSLLCGPLREATPARSRHYGLVASSEQVFWGRLGLGWSGVQSELITPAGFMLKHRQ